MADLTNGSGVFQTYNNAGTGVAELGDNKKTTVGTGNAGRTLLVKVAKTDMSQAELDTLRINIQQGGTFSGVTNDPATIVGISSDGGDTGGPAGDGVNSNAFVDGESDFVLFLLQTTGTFNADSTSSPLGVASSTVTIEAVFSDFADEPDTAVNVAPQLSGNFS